MKAAAAAFLDPDTAELSDEDLKDLEAITQAGAPGESIMATEISAVFLLVKVTLVFAGVLIAMRRLHQTSLPAVRHLLCAAAFRDLAPAVADWPRRIRPRVPLPIVVSRPDRRRHKTAGTLPALSLWKGLEII